MAGIRRGSLYDSGEQWMLHFDEKGGKWREIPVRHNLEQMLLTETAMSGVDVYRMVKRRLGDAGLPTRLSPRSFRVTTITDLLEQAFRSKTCSAWPAMPTRAPRASTNRRDKKITRNIVERISI